MRLDHLLSKEHHVPPFLTWVRVMRLGEVVPAPVVGDPVVQIDLRSSKRRHQPPGLSWWPAFGLGTLLGPEATGLVVAPWWGGGCCRSILVVGCGVCFVDSGCEHLTSKMFWSCLFCNFCFLVFVCVSV